MVKTKKNVSVMYFYNHVNPCVFLGSEEQRSLHKPQLVQIFGAPYAVVNGLVVNSVAPERSDLCCIRLLITNQA